RSRSTSPTLGSQRSSRTATRSLSSRRSAGAEVPESRCWVTNEPIDPSALLSGSTTTADGATILFLGVVRDHNEGRTVGHLDYQAYPEMAEAVLREIVSEAISRWQTGNIRVVHRV